MENLWTRRTNNNKLSLSTTSDGIGSGTESSRNTSFSKRQGGDGPSHLRSNPSAGGSTTPGGGSSLTSPGGSMSGGAFGLGSGAFASFGSAKTPKSTGNPFEAAMTPSPASAAAAREPSKSASRGGAGGGTSSVAGAKGAGSTPGPLVVHALRDEWTFWYRPPISKAHGFIEYEHTLHPVATARTVEDFWSVYAHLKRPSSLPVVSDYHLFKKDVRPIWEDDINRKGGKWVVRMKKGVADRLWEDLLLALVGDQFGDAGEDVCGAVLSVRNGEDILSIWTRTDGGRVLKIRETMKHVLNFPPNTRVEFKSHDSSIQQRTAIDEQRREKANQHHEKRQTRQAE
ncbi:translation initiation factor 4E [Geosmithia morbida]|uniref:Translation initiation factor 4E n=1 Tax=Geosmithia morbida TaxID=1094350 RepID=A0A9P5CZG5_9HYPO|nr:translation initiation factor 4E [Geosmithia morbida]KAF4120467.1 translation initiation factor 4E [Geosmithia morbida]